MTNFNLRVRLRDWLLKPSRAEVSRLTAINKQAGGTIHWVREALHQQFLGLDETAFGAALGADRSLPTTTESSQANAAALRNEAQTNAPLHWQTRQAAVSEHLQALEQRSQAHVATLDADLLALQALPDISWPATLDEPVTC